ncbi:MAG TPA: tetratricopeptide repeat protein [Rhodanobacter sp.]
MSELLQQFHFLRPWWLTMLLLLPALAWLGTRRNPAQMALSRLVDADLLPYLLRGRPVNRSLPVWLFAAGWTLCALALAGPSWSRVAQPLYASRAAQVVAISLSQRMLARDVAPTRLDRARFKARDLLHANRDGLNALIGYAGEAFVVAPLTTDAHSLDDLLDAMAPDTMPVDGNNAAAAIELGVRLIRDANSGGGSLVLITDQAGAAAQAAARAADAAGVRVSVLGVGTAEGGPVPLADGGFLRDAQGHMLLAHRDGAALAALATAGGGRYVSMSTDQSDIDALHSLLRMAPAQSAVGQSGDVWQDRGPWLLLPLLLVVALAFRRGWLLLLPVVVLPLLPGTAVATTTWQDLWQRPDQQAAQALQAGQAGRALQLARDPAWRGVAAYRAGDYAAAGQALAQASGSDPAYNLGNALARQGQYEQALAAYERALKLDPANADAEANRQAVEDWLRRQQEQSSDQKPHEGHDGDKGQQSQGKQGDSGKQDGKEQQAASGSERPSEQEGGQGKSQEGQDQRPSSPGQSGQEDGGAPRPQSAQEQAQQQAQAEQARKALKEQMDEALAKSGNKPSEHQLGRLARDDPQAQLPADLRHALQRVPDDPGALLRRKFALEYQQRHGGAVDEGGQP